MVCSGVSVETLTELAASIKKRSGKGGVCFNTSEAFTMVNLIRMLDEHGFEFDPNSGKAYSRKGIRVAKGDVRSTLVKLITSATPAGFPKDLPASFIPS